MQPSVHPVADLVGFVTGAPARAGTAAPTAARLEVAPPPRSVSLDKEKRTRIICIVAGGMPATAVRINSSFAVFCQARRRSPRLASQADFFSPCLARSSVRRAVCAVRRHGCSRPLSGRWFSGTGSVRGLASRYGSHCNHLAKIPFWRGLFAAPEDFLDHDPIHEVYRGEGRCAAFVIIRFLSAPQLCVRSCRTACPA